MENNQDHKRHKVTITTRDRLLRAWQNSMELTRDFEIYSQEIKDDVKTAQMFAQLAEDQAHHAAALRKRLLEYQDSQG